MIKVDVRIPYWKTGKVPASVERFTRYFSGMKALNEWVEEQNKTRKYITSRNNFDYPGDIEIIIIKKY